AEKYGTTMEDLRQIHQELTATRDNLQATGNGLMHDINEIHKSSGLLDILEHSEHHEHAATCPFVPMALDFETNEYASLQDMEDQYTELENSHKELTAELTDLEHYMELLDRFMTTVLGTFRENQVDFELVGITEDKVLDLLPRNFFEI